MATLNIRNIPEEVRTRLRIRAAKAGRSMEAEIRAILAAAAQEASPTPFDPRALQDFIASLFDGAPPPLTDELIAERRRETARERKAARGRKR